MSVAYFDPHAERHDERGDEARRDGGGMSSTDHDPGGKGQEEDRRRVVGCEVAKEQSGLRRGEESSRTQGCPFVEQQPG